MKLALTLDDAPTIVEPGLPVDPEWMNEILDLLQRAHVAHCIAFVVGERALGHEEALRRWLAAGYELGNHSFYHHKAGDESAEQTIASLRLCDQLLTDVGAFDKHPKWLRFPYLSRGKDPDSRAKVQDACLTMGYQMAPASVNFDDDRFELAWQNSKTDAERQQIISRYVHSVTRAVKYADWRARSVGIAPSLGQIGYAHFGPITCATLPRLIDALRSSGCCLVPLADVATEPLYQTYSADFTQDGLVTDAMGQRTIIDKIARKLAPLSERLQLFGQSSLGPIWPYLS